jgi:hypothetical protein
MRHRVFAVAALCGSFALAAAPARPVEVAPTGMLSETRAGGPQGERRNAAEPIEGHVRSTRVVDGVVYVTVSVGSEDAVTRRTTLLVYGGRAGREVLGTIVITTVDLEESVGRVTGPRAAEVREGNRVRSQDTATSPPRIADVARFASSIG